MSGYMGKVLWVDLDKGCFLEEQIPDSVYHQYLSGIGLAAHLLYDAIPAGADPLGPENIFGVVSGLLTATPTLFSGRWMAVGKSPLTNTWGESNCGGYFSMAIKKCGYDAIFFSGQSRAPVYLFVGPGGPELIDAKELWGMDTVATEDYLREKHGMARIPGVISIGQAGENQSLIAGICHDHGRMAARSGLGAVMGSKKLKAIVLTGTKFIPTPDTNDLRQLNRKPARLAQFQIPLSAWMMSLVGKVLANPWVMPRWDGILFHGVLRKWGTVGLIQTSVEWGDAPIKNWHGTRKDYPKEKSKHISPAVVTTWEQQKYHCLACPLGCGGRLRAEGQITPGHKPEYETTMAFSGLLLNDDWESVIRINDLLDRAGMDSISAGATIAAAIEWYQQGLITHEDTGSLELNWGSTSAIEALVQAMIARQGIGDTLADGTKRAAQRLGIKNRQAVITGGGSELAFHDPRVDPGFGLHAAVEPSPGRHTTGAFIYYDLFRLWTRIPSCQKPPLISRKHVAFLPSKENALKSVAISKFTNFYNALGICLFGIYQGIDRLPLFEYTNAVTGWSLTPEDYMKIGHRIQTLKQMFNIKHGVEPANIRVSSRALGMPPQKTGPNQGKQVHLEALRRIYWDEIGWNPDTGWPTQETLIDLGLLERVEGWEV
jgi:aldehyde:ferredoxin oxidoreductase